MYFSVTLASHWNRASKDIITNDVEISSNYIEITRIYVDIISN